MKDDTKRLVCFASAFIPNEQLLLLPQMDWMDTDVSDVVTVVVIGTVTL